MDAQTGDPAHPAAGRQHGGEDEGPVLGGIRSDLQIQMNPPAGGRCCNGLLDGGGRGGTGFLLFAEDRQRLFGVRGVDAVQGPPSSGITPHTSPRAHVRN